MPPHPAWFTVTVRSAQGGLRIRGEATGGRNWDNAYPYDVHVEAEGLRIDTEKLFDPGQIEAFVQHFGELGKVGGDLALRSVMAADFDLSIVARQGVGRLTFRLRHGNENQWNVEWTVDADLPDIQVELGE